MLSFQEVRIGEGGICPCALCGTSNRVPRAAGDVVCAIDSAAQNADSRNRNVIFTGFEPFAHPGLPALVSAAVRAGFERIRLRSDAGGLARPGNAEGVIGAGVRQLEVVLLGDEETHDALSSRRGLFRAAIDGVTSFRAAADKAGADVIVTGLVPTCRHNVGHLVGAVLGLAEMSAEAVVIDVSAKRPDAEVLESVLDTATVNLIAASVVPGDMPVPYDRVPWSVSGSAR